MPGFDICRVDRICCTVFEHTPDVTVYLSRINWPQNVKFLHETEQHKNIDAN